MSSKLPGSWIGTIMLSVVFCCHAAPALSAENDQLSVVPDRCISLLKGRTCYQRVQFRWKLPDTEIANANGKICLWREGDSAALTCWDGELEGAFRYSLEAVETTSFHLVEGSGQLPIISSTSVTVSWVYNKRGSRRSRWRLF